jgi:hypothetical protein
MIRFPDAFADIEAAIEATSPGWLDEATRRTDVLAALGEYVEEYVDKAGKREDLAPNWGLIKPVLMARQHNKCMYCETAVEGGDRAHVAWDIEHFRPKDRVRAWKAVKAGAGCEFETGGASEAGYFLLAYHFRNYGAACKICNTTCKGRYFPIAGERLTNRRDPGDCKLEEPFLVYPLGGLDDDDPEDLITFAGLKAVPNHASDEDRRKWLRAVVIIKLLDLNRDGLLNDRARWLRATVWPAFRSARAGDEKATRLLAWIRSEQSPFTSCSRCFLALCDTNRDEAESMIPVFDRLLGIMSGQTVSAVGDGAPIRPDRATKRYRR